MRNSKQRNLILKIVNNSYNHLTAYQIYEMARYEISNISLGTVYRNLSCLVSDGKIRKIDIDGNLRFDKNAKHIHFICSECNSIVDIFDDVFDNNKYIDGNLVMDYDIKLKGICKGCIERKEKNNGIKRK